MNTHIQSVCIRVTTHVYNLSHYPHTLSLKKQGEKEAQDGFPRGRNLIGAKNRLNLVLHMLHTHKHTHTITQSHGYKHPS